jgi:hypothetical protein
VRASALVEGLLLALSIGCQASPRAERRQLEPPAPRRAGAFACSAGECRQPQPRLPDTGEWRCAERAKVVWCAGGEPAAGVVPGAPDARFQCAARWGGGTVTERVCIDRRPDYPDGARDDYDCRYDQERGLARVCRKQRAATGPAFSPLALPACWLDRDCPSQRCDRGACACRADADCERGRCRDGLCAEAQP